MCIIIYITNLWKVKIIIFGEKIIICEKLESERRGLDTPIWSLSGNGIFSTSFVKQALQYSANIENSESLLYKNLCGSIKFPKKKM